MYGTPRLRSAFPATPQSTPNRQSIPKRPPGPRQSVIRPSGSTPIRQAVPASGADSSQPLIPFDIVDAPTQRLLVTAGYGILTALRFFDSWKEADDLDSTWLFLKWVFIDFVAMFTLPTLRIPWLEWSFGSTVTVFLLHATMNMFLMFHIPIPIMYWLAWLTKQVYDRELAISERRVNPAGIIHNASLILGKQIIQILPEGSAILNPDRTPLCLDSVTSAVELPIRVNQTNPVLIELLRFDPESEESETITIGSKAAKQMKRQADKANPKSDTNSPRTLHYTIKKTGIYSLRRVIDESQLEVQKKAFDTIIPNCPQANIITDSKDKCSGDMSSLDLKVTGLPPFKVKYSKEINNHESSSHFQNIQPNDLFSPLTMQQPSNALISLNNPDMSWAKSADVTVPINELMLTTGTWSYTIEAVQDGSGNMITYKPHEDASGSKRTLSANQQQDIWVHRRPQLSMSGCSAESPSLVAEGSQIRLPISSTDLLGLGKDEAPLHIEYSFAPQAGEDLSLLQHKSFDFSDARSIPMIRESGFYTLQAVRSPYCTGTVNEPASCLLENPPKPDVVVKTREVTDECAGNVVGLIADLELTGTPPFRVRYSALHDGSLQPRYQDFDGSRGQIDLIPMSAGSYVYEFLEVIDSIYPPFSLRHRNLILNQNVKPAASAKFVSPKRQHVQCLGSPFTVEVTLHGEAPWNLEYEIIHRGKRQRRTAVSESNQFMLTTDTLNDGGQYSIVMTGVTDKSKCKRSVNEEIQFEIRSEQPKVAFREIDGTRSTLALEGRLVKLPIRLRGLAPWTISLMNLDSGSVTKHILQEANSAITVNQPGTYELTEVRDSCPGFVDPTANVFTVSWIERPSVSIKEDNLLTDGERSYKKPGVCEGEIDQLQLAMKGNPTFELKYSLQQRPVKGSGFMHHEKLSAAIRSATVYMDTTKAGQYKYTFESIADNLYDHDSRNSKDLIVTQEVYSLPNARFQSPGKTYGYCTNEAGGSEVIPMILEGQAPWTVDIGILHHGNARPEIIKLKIQDPHFDWSLSRRGLDLGTHSVQIRKVQDGRGCERVIQQDPTSVRILVSDVPTISPLESQTDYCVGEHISFSLSGLPPFQIFYRFQNYDRKATVTSSSNPEFRRIAEQPGDFTIMALSDNASGKCRAEKNITKVIHPLPTVKVSGGQISTIDIHEGGEAEILFDFTGTPPFEFTFTRSELTGTKKGLSKKSGKSMVLETRTERSHAFEKRIRVTDAGIYEVTAIKDRFCSFSVETGGRKSDYDAQRLLQS